MDQPLTRWYCDVCHQPIEPSESKYVIWKDTEESQYKAHSFKIIHQGRCDQQDHGCSAALSDFLGADGLAKLLAFLSLGPLKPQPTSGVMDVDEFVDFARRVQTPHYEEARRKFGDAQDDFYDANEVFPYLQDALKSIISRY